MGENENDMEVKPQAKPKLLKKKFAPQKDREGAPTDRLAESDVTEAEGEAEATVKPAVAGRRIGIKLKIKKDSFVSPQRRESQGVSATASAAPQQTAQVAAASSARSVQPVQPVQPALAKRPIPERKPVQGQRPASGSVSSFAASRMQPVSNVIRKKPVIIRDSESLPNLRKPVIIPGQRRAAGLVSGRRTDGSRPPARGGMGPGQRAPGSFGDRRPFRPSSGPGKVFEIPQSQGPKRRTTAVRKVNYSKKNQNQDEKNFDIAKKKAVSYDAVPKKIDIMNFVTPGELARKMNLKAGDIISKLISMGSMVTINEQIDSETASIIAAEYGCEVHIVDLYQETVIESEETKEENLVPRAPIVTVMGHVDHGKTKLLDAIRSSNVAQKEFGGITQHIGAYKVKVGDRGEVVFIDTPGHAAFTAMRARGAQVTDIVVLVVAANDGVMPQTLEAIDHAKAAKVPIIVAINKCDLPESNPDRVKQQLSEKGLTPEEWGGTTQFCNISALKKEGIDDLLESILIQAEMLELKADPTVRAQGIVLESKIDPGRGVVATVMVRQGTLRKEDDFVAGIYQGRVRTIVNDRRERILEAGPSTPVEITGMSDVPNAGDPFQVTEDEHKAKFIATKRQELERLGQREKYKRVTLDNLNKTIQEGSIQEFNVIVKGDVQGSVEALEASLSKLETPQIRLVVLRAAAGAIIEDDINLAASSENGALIIAFNVRPTPRALQKAESEKIEIRKYNVIYDVIEDMKKAMEGKLEPVKKEQDVGRLEVRDTFRVPKVGVVAGCMVVSGKITRKCFARVVRDNIQISQKPIRISSLKRFKDDVKDVLEGFECGVGLEDFQDIQTGDIIEAVEIVEVAQKLDFGSEVI